MLSITAGLPDAAVNLHLNELAAAQRPCLDIIGKILGAIPTAQLAEELSNRIGDGDVLDVKVWRKDDLRIADNDLTDSQAEYVAKTADFSGLDEVTDAEWMHLRECIDECKGDRDFPLT